MFQRVDVQVVNAPFHVVFIATRMLKKPALPYPMLAFDFSAE